MERGVASKPASVSINYLAACQRLFQSVLSKEEHTHPTHHTTHPTRKPSNRNQKARHLYSDPLTPLEVLQGSLESVAYWFTRPG